MFRDAQTLVLTMWFSLIASMANPTKVFAWPWSVLGLELQVVRSGCAGERAEL